MSFHLGYFFFFKQKTAYEMRISGWSSDVCSSQLPYATVFYTLEARRRTGTYESALAGDAMIIHKVEDYGTAYSVDADVPPADVSNNEGSMFKPGEAWQSPDRSRWIRVDAMTETGFTVTIGPQLRITGGRLPALDRESTRLKSSH